MSEIMLLSERTIEEKHAYLQGYEAGIRAAAKLAAIYEGQSEVAARIERAGRATAELIRGTLDA